MADHELVSPPIARPEALSSLSEMRYRGEISEALAELALEALLALKYETRDEKQLPRAAWDIARRLGWAKTYDAEYVALAQLLDCPLVTLDERLRRGAGRLARIITAGEVR